MRKNILCLIIGMLVILGLAYGKATIYDGLLLINMPTDWENAHLTIDTSGNVYVDELAGAYAYQYNWPATSVITWWERVPLSGAFINEVTHWFIGSGDMIVYQWHQKRMRFVMTWYWTTSVKDIDISLWVKINGDLLTGSVNGTSISSVGTEKANTISTSQAVLSSGDTVQLVITADKISNLTPITVTAYANQFF